MFAWRLAAALVALTLVTAACGGDDDDDTGGNGNGGSARTTAPEVPLVSTPWSLTEAPDIELPPDTEFTATFESGRVSGRSGCNTFAGPYTADGSSLTIGELATTRMACDQEVMDAETAFLAALGDTASYTGSETELRLLDADGETLLVFQGLGPADLASTWSTTGLLSGDAFSSLVAGTAITADFGADGRVSGNAGCNQYGGTYSTDGEEVTIHSVVATEMACTDPDGVMEQEQTYLELLGRVATYQVDRHTLTLLDDAGTRLAEYAHTGD